MVITVSVLLKELLSAGVPSSGEAAVKMGHVGSKPEELVHTISAALGLHSSYDEVEKLSFKSKSRTTSRVKNKL
jgi:hypothetical protein